MAALEQYAMPSAALEVALARSAAPPAISGAAEVLVLTPHGYVVGAPGQNGFVCLVERSWSSAFDDPEFWNPKVRAPNCYNRAAALSVLPAYLKRTKWALEGLSSQQIRSRLKAAVDSAAITPPITGAMSYMMSKDGYLSDAAGHAHAHLMVYLPITEASAWGANIAAGPITAAQGAPEPLTIFFMPALTWSDGTSALEHRMLLGPQVESGPNR